MTEVELSKLSDEELQAEFKKLKPYPIYDSVIIGLLIGVAIYSAVKNGFGLLTFLPLIYLPAAAKNRNKIKALEALMKERNLSNKS